MKKSRQISRTDHSAFNMISYLGNCWQDNALVAVWFLIYGLTGAETYFRCRVIRRMNNAIREDIASMLLQKTIGNFISNPWANTYPCLPMISPRLKILPRILFMTASAQQSPLY